MPARAARARRHPRPSAGTRVLHLDAFSGIAGNMFLGALLDAGLSRKQLTEDLGGLGVEFALRVRRVQRGALAARYLDVRVPGARGRRPKRARRRRSAGSGPGHAPHDHDHDHDHGHHHGHAHAHHAHGESEPHLAHDHEHGRSYVEIVDLLRGARLEETVRARALATFEALGRAEARVHGIALEAVRFHEVGAVDAIVDITGAAIALHRLGVGRVTCTPVALGHGMADMAHGRLPLPAPATLELLKGIPTVPAHVDWETVTPTGAALLRTCVDEFRTLPAIRVEAVGYGAGNDRPGPVPNVLRAVVGRSGDAEPAADRVVAIETNLDDLVPEHFDYLMERLLESGALDVSLQHVQMKKNRPGFLLRVLARPSDRAPLARLLLAESSAIGVRTSEWDRLVLAREVARVDTPFGRIRVKRVRDPDGRESVSAEYDDCKRAARRARVPLREVVRVAEEHARREAGP